MDFSNISFNPNAKAEAAAKDAATGARLLILGLSVGFASLLFALFFPLQESLAVVISITAIAASVISAYGVYLAASALGWEGLVTWIIIFSVFIPYLKFIPIIILIAYSMDRVRSAGYKFSLFGNLQKKRVA